MNKFTNQDFLDFKFKDKKLSDLGGYVGNTDEGFKTYSVLPSRERVIDRPLNSDIAYQFASSFAPRVFEVPIIFEQLTDGKLREIAEWLDSPEAYQFMFVGDDVYINAMLDSQDFNATSSTGQDGQIAVKFICLDPFYYSLNETQYTVASLTSETKYTYSTDSYGETYPELTIGCSGDIKIEIMDENDNVYSTTNITDITGGVIINSTTKECTLLSGASHFAKIDKFPFIKKGVYSIKITGTSLTNMVINYRERYI